jgi:predicted ABC-type ATPase
VAATPDEVGALTGTGLQAGVDETRGKAVLVILTGAPGAGKTTFYEGQLKSVFSTILRASASPLEQSQTERERRRLIKEEQSLVYQDVTANVKLIDEAHKAAYDVKVIYVGTEDPSLNIGRILVRAGQGGPFAAVGRIGDDFSQGLKQLPEIKRRADDLMVFDNTMNGRCARLVAHFREGELVKLARSVPRWAEKVFGREFDRWVRSEQRSRAKSR